MKNKKLTNKQVKSLRDAYAQGDKVEDLADRFKISTSLAYSVLANKPPYYSKAYQQECDSKISLEKLISGFLGVQDDSDLKNSYSFIKDIYQQITKKETTRETIRSSVYKAKKNRKNK